jgi:hypothetical protein
MPKPGTSCVTCALWNAAGSVPPDVGSMSAVSGPAPSWFTWWNVIFTTPLSEHVGRPEAAPWPTAAWTPVSTVPLGVLVPPLPSAAPPPRRPPRRPRLDSDSKCSSRAALAEVVLPPGPFIKAATMVAALTGPEPTVRPRALALSVPSSFLRMMEVSASAPQAGVAQSRGVPSATEPC